MLNVIHGSAPGTAVGTDGERRTFLHRYELVGAALVRRAVADRRPRQAREVRLVDVLLDEGPAGRSLRAVRGIALDERELARLDGAAGPIPWREFPVGDALVRAIAADLDAAPCRSAAPPRGAALRLATRDGATIDSAAPPWRR